MTLPIAPEVQVRVFEDVAGRFHYQPVIVGMPHARKAPTFCGADIETMRRIAWFDVGDRRGQVHYERACDDCREGLQV